MPGSASPQSRSANDTVRVGVIGPGGRGTAVMKECIEYGSRYNVRVTAVCDIWKQRLEAAAKLVSESYGTKAKTYPRYEALLDDKDLDAVIIAFGERITGEVHQVREMSVALLRDDGTFQLLGAVGNGFGEQDRAGASAPDREAVAAQLLDRLEQL